MKIRALKERIANADPLLVDVGIAFMLALLVCLQIWLVANMRPQGMPLPPNARIERFGGHAPTFVAYIVAACAFLPLAFRRTVPWLAFVLSGAAVLVYSVQPMPPAFVTLGPMLALYSLAAYANRRHTGLIALLVVGVVVAVPVFAFSSSVRWVAELVGSFVLLAAAALLGDADRNRREYIAEVEARALEAERTREEEAKRRVDEERIRIAREVHDIVAHSLSIVTIQASAAAAQLDTDLDGARESLENVRTTGREALSELRSMLDVLRTGEAEAPLEPAAAIEQLDHLLGPLRETGLDVSLQVEGDASAVPAYASVSAYRIVQEALTNTVRHAQATQARVHVNITTRDVVVEITDNGSGQSLSPTIESSGHGVRGMRERVDALGGTFSASPGSESGFRVFASIPLTRSAS